MSLALPKDNFYVLEVTKTGKRELSIHVEMGTAVDKIHEYITKDVPSNKISLMNVTVGPKDLKGLIIPWSTIAVELIKTVKK